MFKLLFLTLPLLLLSCSQNNSPLKIDQELFLTSNSSSLDFGSLTYQQAEIRTIKITNDLPSATESPVIPLLAEPNSSYFSIAYKNNCDKVLNSGESCILKIQVKNTSLGGQLIAQLLVDHLSIDLSASAENITSGNLVFQANGANISLLDFGSSQNTTLTKTIFLKNNSKINSVLGEVGLSNSNFIKTYDNCSFKTLAPLKSCKILISFSSKNKADQIYSDSLTVNSLSLPLTGQVLGGTLSNPVYDLSLSEKGVTISSLDFGNPSSVTSKTIYVKNIGNTSINGLNPQVSNNLYQIIFSSCDGQIAPDKACIVKLSFNPIGRDSGFYNDNLNLGVKNLPLSAANKPIISSATLSGPASRLFNGVYYTASALGGEIIPEVLTQANGAGNAQLTVLYALNDTCSGAVELSNFVLPSNQPSFVYTKVVDGNNISSDCVLVGQIVHDNVSPNISFNNSSFEELNMTGESNSFSYLVEASDLNQTSNFEYQIYSNKLCSTPFDSSSLAPLSPGSNSVMVALNRGQYKSILVKSVDKAGNEHSLCSPYITYGQPGLIEVPLFSLPSKIYETEKTFSGVTKDIYNNIVPNVDLSISSPSQTINLTSDGSGSFNFKVSSLNTYNSLSGVKINYINNNLEKVEVTSLLNPLVKLVSPTFQVVRRSCQELALFDNISANGDFTVDSDLDGVGIETSITCNFATGIDLESVPFTSITNRAKISRSLKTVMGLERMMINGLSLAPGESVPGLNVYAPTGSSLIRLVGQWKFNDDNAGKYAYLAAGAVAGVEYIEVSFFGTGLNLLTLQNNFDRDVRVSVDGGAESGNIMTGSAGDDMYNTFYYRANNVINLTSNLTLGWHTVKLRNLHASGLQVYGFEVVNDRSNILAYQGGAMNLGQLEGITTAQTSSYTSDISGTKGGRVVKYVEDNQLKTATTLTDASVLYMANADHSNEEVVRTINFREFGSNTSTDFSTLTGTVSDRYFPMEEISTALFGFQVATMANNEMYGSTNGYMGFTFVGTGLDIVLGNSSSSNSVTLNIIIDGTNVSTLTIPGVTPATQRKIVSGLPFGAHQVIINRNSGVSTNSFSLKDFIIYHPKKPTITSGKKIVSDYSVLANFVPAVATTSTVATGALRLHPLRDITYINGTQANGTGIAAWSTATGNAYFNFVETYSNKRDAYMEFSFFGTGFQWRGYVAANGSSSNIVRIDGNIYTGAASVSGGTAWNPATGSLNLNNATTNSAGSFVVQNLPLGWHKVRITNNVNGTNGSGYLRVSGIDIISPIFKSY